jgi:hypothetical protein
MKRYTTECAVSFRYDSLEMELYDVIDDEIFFPSSLSTVGTFNFPQDYECLIDSSFKERRITMCFEVTQDKKPYSIKRDKRKWFSKWRKQGYHWSIADPKKITIKKAIPLFSFNLPEYCLSSMEPKPAKIQWYPDLFLLSENNWRLLIGNKEEVYQQIRNINRGKIYRILGLSMNKFLSQIDKIWEVTPLSNLSKLQIFSDIRCIDLINDVGGRIVHRLKLLRKNVQ